MQYLHSAWTMFFMQVSTHGMCRLTEFLVVQVKDTFSLTWYGVYTFNLILVCYLVCYFYLVAYEKATKEQRMRTEISQAKKEANFYLQNVEKGKAIDAMETRKRKRADQVRLQCTVQPQFTQSKNTQSHKDNCTAYPTDI